MRKFLPVVLCCLLFSCKKNDNPPPVAGTMNINLSFPSPDITREIIISESNGKVLLDMVAPFANSLVATLKTNEASLDFTTIGYDSVVRKGYVIMTYKGVNPSAWASVYGPDPGTYTDKLPSRDAFVYYKNVPALGTIGDRIFQTDYYNLSSWSATSTTFGTLDMHYIQHGSNNYLYTLFPNVGLYNFHIPKGINDTIDLVHMDTTASLYFNNQSSFKLQPANLIGIMDTNDISKSVLLYFGLSFQGQGLPDLMYPKKLVQKYEMTVSAFGTEGKNDYYSYGDTIQTYLPAPTPSYYTITASQSTHFAAKFNASHPTYYATYWRAGDIYWTIYASSDSTDLDPLKLLTSLDSRQLKGKDMSGLKLAEFLYANATGMDYAAYVNYSHDPAQLKLKKLRSLVAYGKFL